MLILNRIFLTIPALQLFSLSRDRQKNPLCLFAWLHTKLSEVTLLWVEFSLCAAYCPPIDFMATVTNIFRIKFRGAAERVCRKLGNFPLKMGEKKREELRLLSRLFQS